MEGVLGSYRVIINVTALYWVQYGITAEEERSIGLHTISTSLPFPLKQLALMGAIGAEIILLISVKF